MSADNERDPIHRLLLDIVVDLEEHADGNTGEGCWDLYEKWNVRRLQAAEIRARAGRVVATPPRTSTPAETCPDFGFRYRALWSGVSTEAARLRAAAAHMRMSPHKIPNPEARIVDDLAERLESLLKLDLDAIDGDLRI